MGPKDSLDGLQVFSFAEQVSLLIVGRMLFDSQPMSWVRAMASHAGLDVRHSTMLIDSQPFRAIVFFLTECRGVCQANVLGAAISDGRPIKP